MWKNININKNKIETETYKSVLIKMPNNSEYKGYSFWHPAKLVRKGKNSNSVSIGYTDEFTFNLKKYGNGKHNKFDVIKEQEITVEEFEEAFGVMNENITSKKFKNDYETHKPDELEPTTTTVLDELKDE